MKKQKILLVSTTIYPLPPQGYSGLEQVVYLHCCELFKRNYEVGVIAPKTSKLPDGIKLYPTEEKENEQSVHEKYKNIYPNYDVILDHSWNKFSYINKLRGELKAPVLAWCHAPPNSMFGSAPPISKPCMVGLSKDYAKFAEECWKVPCEYCYNPTDAEFYHMTDDDQDDSYLFLARMSRIKGPDIVADLALQMGFKLNLVGDDFLTMEADYALEILRKCKYNLEGNLTYYGGVSREKTVKFYNKSKCLLHPIKNYREPFGLTLIESQLCGCPVISWDNGAARELIAPGKTGFLVNSVEEIGDLIKNNAVSKINRKYCRDWARQFSVEQSINKVELLIEKALEGGW